MPLTPSVDNEVWICLNCVLYLRKKKIPPESVLNGFVFPNQPPELKDINLAEERLVSPRLPFIYIIERPTGGQLAVKGGIVNVPNNVDKVSRVIPRHCSPEELICIEIKRRMKDNHSYMDAFIRPDAVHSAAKFLVNQPLMEEEGISYDSSWEAADAAENHSFLFGNSETSNTNSNTVHESVEESDDEIAGRKDTLMNQLPIPPRVDKKLVLVPAQGNTPMSNFLDAAAEELAYVTLFCGNRRPSRVSPVPYGQVCKAE